MRIGILTLPLHTNYGGILQAYALQTVLERMGHSVRFIEPEKYPIKSTKQIIRYYLSILAYRAGFHSIVHMLHGEQYVMIQNTKKFIDAYLHIRGNTSIMSIKERDFDAIIVGSDQVWRPMYFGEKRMDKAYLSFTGNWNIKRISYAASFGTDAWELNDEMTESCAKAVSKFNAVSVREKTGLALCRQYLKVESVWALDPTMLLNATDYNMLIRKRYVKEECFLFTYVIDTDPTITDIIHVIANNKGLPIVSSNSRAEDTSINTFSLDEKIQPPVESWLEGFQNAEFIITDSYHACIFSILNKKQFYVVGNQKRGKARFESLLHMLGLESRMISNASEIDINLEIDYFVVDRLLSEMREKSFNFINNHLSD